jgi:hypothetical protein
MAVGGAGDVAAVWIRVEPSISLPPPALLTPFRTGEEGSSGCPEPISDKLAANHLPQ